MICSTLLTNLGYECQAVSERLSYIHTPFMQEDGSNIGVYIEQIDDNKFIVSDDVRTFWEISSRGIDISKARFKTLQARLNGTEKILHDNAELRLAATQADVFQKLQKIVQSSIMVDAMVFDWYKKVADRFEQTVKSRFKQHTFSQRLTFDDRLLGLSGHQISVPINLTGEGTGKRIFTARVSEKGSWASAYGVMGKITDLNADNDQFYVIVDDEAAGNQIDSLFLLFGQTQAKILPYQKQNIWFEQLAA